MAECTKVIGVIITNRAKDFRSLAIARYIRGIMFEENLKDVDAMSGKMESYMKDSGSTGSSMAPGSGEAPREIHTSENGEKAEPMGMEYTPGSMATGTKVNLKTA